MSKNAGWKKNDVEATFRGAHIHLFCGNSIWPSKMALLHQQSGEIRILTHSLPSLDYLAIQFRQRTSGIWILASDEYRPLAEKAKLVFPALHIATHARVHSKVMLIAPDRVFVSSGNLGSRNYHETTVEVFSEVVYDWYLAAVWEPLWGESEEVSGNDL